VGLPLFTSCGNDACVSLMLLMLLLLQVLLQQLLWVFWLPAVGRNCSGRGGAGGRLSSSCLALEDRREFGPMDPGSNFWHGVLQLQQGMTKLLKLLLRHPSTEAEPFQKSNLQGEELAGRQHWEQHSEGGVLH